MSLPRTHDPVTVSVILKETRPEVLVIDTRVRSPEVASRSGSLSTTRGITCYRPCTLWTDRNNGHFVLLVTICCTPHPSSPPPVFPVTPCLPSRGRVQAGRPLLLPYPVPVTVLRRNPPPAGQKTSSSHGE